MFAAGRMPDRSLLPLELFATGTDHAAGVSLRGHFHFTFTVWTLSAGVPAGVKSSDSWTVWRTPSRIPGASLNAGDNPGGEREAAFSSEAERIPHRLRDRK